MAKSYEEFLERYTTPEIRAQAAKRTQELLGEMLLVELRKLTGQSQVELAAKLGIKQPSLSKLERQSDMHLSTLSNVVRRAGRRARPRRPLSRDHREGKIGRSRRRDRKAAESRREAESGGEESGDKKAARKKSVARKPSAKRRGA